MQLSWNDGFRDQIGGQNILGVRQVDQNLELLLVGGITTVSPRARYLTLVPWALSALYQHLLAQGSGTLVWDEGQSNAILTRLEFLIAGATQEGTRDHETGIRTSTLGSDVYREALASLYAGSTTPFPSPRQPGVLNAYRGPLQAFGILDASNVDGPLALTPQGQALVAAMSPPAEVVTFLMADGAIRPDQIALLRAALSLNRLRDAPPECAALLAALDAPGNSEDAARKERFRETRVWAIDQLGAAPTDGDGLINRAYLDLIQGLATSSIAQAWGEVALRKRVHFALELLLASLTETLEADHGSTIDTVVDRISMDLVDQGHAVVLHAVLGKEPVAGHAPWSAFQERIEDDAFLANPPVRKLARLAPSSRLVAALALITSTERQSRTIRAEGIVRDREGAMEKTFARTAQAPGSFFDVTCQVLRYEVAFRHLRHTMRKMSQGQSNSLRFFPRDQALVPTGTPVRGGFSLTRLNSVLRIMADLGHLEDGAGGLQPTEAGLAWAEQVRQ